ncbi:MAG: multifunctional CCA addition/repair protein [Burkholderiales bacterium]
MQVYEVGGAVRDAMLGLPVQDHDYVVVGSSAEEMVERGFRPVGKDFPVFLHADTHEEYALARTERKTGRGYKGFQIYAAPDVTLEQDLARRDLTINAMARSESGELIDPFGGAKDLREGVLRHVSDAFSEDPVRILRVARFAARFGFAVADETLQLMRDMSNSGEVDALVSERVWQELSRGLMEEKPSRMFDVLRDSGALKKILPEVDRLFGVPQPVEHHPEIDTGVHVMIVVDYAAAHHYSLEVRFAALTHDLGKGMTPKAEWPKHHGHEARSVELVKQLCARIKVPGDSRDLAVLAARYHGDIHRSQQLRPETLLRLFKSADAFRRPERFSELLRSCECDARGRLGLQDQPYPQSAYLSRLLAASRSIDAGALAASCSDPMQIEAKVDEARKLAIAAAMGDTRDGG